MAPSSQATLRQLINKHKPPQGRNRKLHATLSALKQRHADLTAAIAALEKLAAHHELYPRPPLARIVEMPKRRENWADRIGARRRRVA